MNLTLMKRIEVVDPIDAALNAKDGDNVVVFNVLKNDKVNNQSTNIYFSAHVF